jgi:hypothetical protein
MNIIFLDVDGVINSINRLIEVYNETHRPHSGYEYPFDEKCLENLKMIVDETDSYIVVTSTWRKRLKGKMVLMSKLKEYGLDKRVIGFTPILGRREDEINSFLSKLDKPYKYVIIDDDLVLDDNFVKVSTQTGLTSEDAKTAIKKLVDKRDLNDKI